MPKVAVDRTNPIVHAVLRNVLLEQAIADVLYFDRRERRIVEIPKQRKADRSNAASEVENVGDRTLRCVLDRKPSRQHVVGRVSMPTPSLPDLEIARQTIQRQLTHHKPPRG